MQLTAFDNGVAERLIGSIRRECTDHIIVLGEAHLRRVLKSYATYYNAARTHRSLNKDSPASRAVHRTGRIISHPALSELHTAPKTRDAEGFLTICSLARRAYSASGRRTRRLGFGLSVQTR